MLHRVFNGFGNLLTSFFFIQFLVWLKFKLPVAPLLRLARGEIDSKVMGRRKFENILEKSLFQRIVLKREVVIDRFVIYFSLKARECKETFDLRREGHDLIAFC